MTKFKNTEKRKAITWLLVTDEQNKPIAVNAPFKNDNPIYEPIIPPVSILPWGIASFEMVNTYNNVGNSDTSTSVKEAKNLPNMILDSVRGNVDNISMVPDLNSSEKERIVNAGIKNISTQGASIKNLSNVAYPSSSILLSGVTQRKKPTTIIKSKIAI